MAELLIKGVLPWGRARSDMLISFINGFRDDDGLELASRMATCAGAGVLGIED